MCVKLGRWHLGLRDHILGKRVLQVLKDSSNLVAPRIKNAQFSILWNRACLLCENPSFRDEVEHRPFCSVVKFWATHILKIDKRIWLPDNKGLHAKQNNPLINLFGIGVCYLGPEFQTKILILQYMIYTAHNCRNNLAGMHQIPILTDTEERKTTWVSGLQWTLSKGMPGA